MYQLNINEIKAISGAKSVYVTQEWKEMNALQTGIRLGFSGAVMGGLFGSFIPAPVIGGAFGALAGGTLGYYGGYALSMLSDNIFENNTWYDFPDVNYVVVVY